METKHFSHKELRCKCGCDKSDMDVTFMDKVEQVRKVFGRPITVSSAFRCVNHDRSVGGAGVHPTGKALDVTCSGQSAHTLLSILLHYGFKGVGVSQNGPHDDRFIHVDDIDSPIHPRPTIWSY